MIKYITAITAMTAQWNRLRLPCTPSTLLSFIVFVLYLLCEKNENKSKRGRVWPIFNIGEGGRRHSSVDSSTLTILWSRVRIPSRPSTMYWKSLLGISPPDWEMCLAIRPSFDWFISPDWNQTSLA